MTILVWDLINSKLYTASAGDSLSFKSNSTAGTLDLITVDQSVADPKEQERLRQSIQAYFSHVKPKKKVKGTVVSVSWSLESGRSSQKVGVQHTRRGEYKREYVCVCVDVSGCANMYMCICRNK